MKTYFVGRIRGVQVLAELCEDCKLIPVSKTDLEDACDSFGMHVCQSTLREIEDAAVNEEEPRIMLTHDQYVAICPHANDFGVRYHVEGYGPGTACHMVGEVLLRSIVKADPGPEGWLRVVTRDGKYYIDECDDDVCPEELQGTEVSAEHGGRWIIAYKEEGDHD